MSLDKKFFNRDTNISAKVICDSINEQGVRLTTFEIEYPRFILAELNTHRQLSRNSSSSRAIPIKKMLSTVDDNMAVPVYWGNAKSGMQADGEVNEDDIEADGSVEVTVLPSGATDTNEGAQFYATNNNQANINIELPDARVGDELNNAGKTALQVYTGAAWTSSTNKWKYKASLTTEAVAALHQKLVNNISEFRILPLKLYQGTLYFRQFFNPHSALIYTINGVSYTLVFNGGSITLDADMIDGEWWLIKRTTGSTTGGSNNTGTKIGTKDIYKDVYPYVDVPKLDNDIKISQYEIGSGTQALSMMRGAIQTLAEAALNYIASDPQFAFQESGATPTATNVREGDICFTNSNGKLWKYTAGSWVVQYTPSGGISGGGTTNEIAYFNGTSSIASLPVATYPSLAELAYVKGVTSAIQTQIDAKASVSAIKVDTRGQLSSSVTLGNTTSQTLLHTITIAAGTLAAGDSVKCLFFASCNNNSNNKVLSVTINNGTSSMSGQMTFTTHTGGIMEVTFKITSLTNIRALNMSNNASYGIISSSSPRNYTVSDISANSFTIDIYGQKITSGSDTLILEHAVAIVQKS